MADDEPQAQEETSWWAFDAFSDASLPETAFDEPLVWPEASGWEAAEETPPAPANGAGDLVGHPADLLFPLIPEEGALFAADPAAFDAPPPPPDDGDATALHVEALPESIWAAEPGEPPAPAAPPEDEERRGAEDLVITSTLAAPAVDTEPSAAAPVRRPHRLDIRHGNAAVVALISFVSLVLLGMFLSVRARNDLPTESIPNQPPPDEIAANRPLNTIPLPTTTAGTAVPQQGISIADLLPPSDETTSTVPGAAGVSRTTAPATTTPRATTPTGGGTSGGGGASGGGGSTQPAADPTTTTPAPEVTSPATTSPPVDDTTPTTRRSTTTVPTTDFTRPTFTVPTTAPRPTLPPNFTIPTAP